MKKGPGLGRHYLLTMAKPDTQLPRFQVFLQEKTGQPHQDVGSVHASDPEMALLNARDVFVRRPECTSLWVVLADAIFSKTAQELEEQELGDKGLGDEGVKEESGEVENYYIFYKPKPTGTQTLVGEVPAAAPVEALRLALERFSGDKPPSAWWILPARRVLVSSPDDIESMFAPAQDKKFRLSTDFHTLTEMRRVKSEFGGQ